MALHQVQQFGVGANDGVYSQVDPSHLSQRVALRPWEYNAIGGAQGGHYKVGAMGGALAGALTAPNQVLSVRWAAADRLMVLERLSLGVLCTAFSSGISLDVALTKATSFSANSSGSGSTTPTPTPVRLTMPASQFLTSGELRIHGTVGLTAGTQTLAASPLAYDVKQITAVQQYSTFDLLRSIDLGASPMIFAANEGFVARLETLNLPASNTIRFVVTMEWIETAVV